MFSNSMLSYCFYNFKNLKMSWVCLFLQSLNPLPKLGHVKFFKNIFLVSSRTLYKCLVTCSEIHLYFCSGGTLYLGDKNKCSILIRNRFSSSNYLVIAKLIFIYNISVVKIVFFYCMII